MISLLRGTIESVGKDAVVVLTAGGVGYEVKSKLKTQNSKVGDKVSLYTYLKVSDQALELYGFETSEEREFFTLLMTVSGVGPKTAMNILSLGSIHEIQSAIGRGDVKYLTAVSGLGRKTAERLVVELRSKMKEQGTRNKEQGGDSEILGEVIDALEAMGYGREEARQVVMELPAEGKSTQELLKLALREIR